MYKKRLRNRVFKTTGPLQKMINDAVEERMTALKKEEEPAWSDWMETKREQLDDGRTKITEGRQGTIPGEKDDYSGEGGYMPDDAWNEWLQTPDGQAYTEKHSPKEVEEERVRFLEAVPQRVEAVQADPIATPERPEMQTVKRQEGSQNLAEILGQNPEQIMTSNASDFFNTEFSNDNPTFDIIKDDKFMRKARKAYEKMNYSSRQRQTMPFNRWLMTGYKPKGMDGTLIEQARTWEGDNATDTDSSGEGGAVNRDTESARQSSEARYSASSDDWRNKRSTGQGQPTNMKRPVTKMLQGRTMSFRKNKF